jgi:hypothetical protein
MNGADGQDGAPGATGPAGPAGADGQDAVLSVVDPCGPLPGNQPNEVLFQLSTGRYAAWYKDIGLVLLSDGNWQTTDAQHCHFQVSGGGTSISW